MITTRLGRASTIGVCLCVSMQATATPLTVVSVTPPGTFVTYEVITPMNGSGLSGD